MSKSFVFSSESVGEGHPDKVADLISDSVLDACIAQDPASRVACETLVKSNQVVIAGEITTAAKINYETVVRDAIRTIVSAGRIAGTLAPLALENEYLEIGARFLLSNTQDYVAQGLGNYRAKLTAVESAR